MQDALKTYLAMATGLSDVSRKKAKAAAKKLAKRGGATVEQIQTLTEDLVSTSTNNRDALQKIVRLEVDRALGLVGLATADEVETLTSRVRDLERELAAAKSKITTTEAAAAAAKAEAEAVKAPVKRAPARKAPAKAPAKTAAPKTAAAKTTAPAKKTAHQGGARPSREGRSGEDSSSQNGASQDLAGQDRELPAAGGDLMTIPMCQARTRPAHHPLRGGPQVTTGRALHHRPDLSRWRLSAGRGAGTPWPRPLP
ncbi:phasin family protein [Fodinicola feengrottensis]|uniref:phasin family protein n=1 Tax=Fodinicola feengrottensis TaxID=435914 RepID=UPI0024411B57|nr:hypothetical protein [Fodinicola feengrottensis]